jgi:amino acid transporter
VPIASGVIIALTVHGVKAASRPVINATTAGFGAPVASTAEDLGSIVLSLLAILVPILVLLGLVLLVSSAIWVIRRRRLRKRECRPVEGVTTERLFG